VRYLGNFDEGPGSIDRVEVIEDDPMDLVGLLADRLPLGASRAVHAGDAAEVSLAGVIV
jgi:hypothetical protein